jgi:uncharacterized protein DUF4397
MNHLFRALALVAASLLSGCGGGSLSINEGQLRLVNATTEFASLDLFAANTAVVTGVAPLSASGYGNLKADGYTLDVRASGSSTSLVSTSATVVRKQNQTVVAYTSAGSIAATVLSDEEGDPSSGTAKLRVFHTANADAGPVDVYLVAGACATLATSAAAPFASNVDGLQSAYTQVTSSATPVHLCVTSVGDKTDVRLDIPSLVLSEKRIVTIILVHGSGGVLLNGLVVDQQGALTQALNTSARVRVAASISPPRAVDVDVNGTTVAAGLSTPAVGPYVTVNAGTLTVKIDATTVTPATPLTAAPGADVTLLLTGTTPTLTLLNDDNTQSSSSARPVKMRLVNGLNGVAGTATLTVDNAPIGNGAAFAAASPYAFLPASAALAQIDARAGVLPLFHASNVTLSAGHVYSVFLLGDVAAPNGILVADH